MSCEKIAVGSRVGMLTVESAASERKNGYMVWVCRCDCVTKVRPGQVDLTGQRFDRLVVEEPTSMRAYGGSVVWKCRCDCGNEALISGKQLSRGYKKSCGCLSHPPVKDYVGKVFGQLTVTAYIGKEKGQHLWECQCTCGKRTVVRQTYLQSGKTKSCGCLQKTVIGDNLRLVEGTSVTLLEAGKDRLISSNTSGHTGVYLNKKNRKWVAQITFKKKRYYLGCYDRIEDAVRMRRIAEERMFGEFLEWYHTACKKDEQKEEKENSMDTSS